MLRTASAEAIAAHDPLGMASFPLVPYSNRIADARFGWAGQTHAITPNFPPEPHAIHGIGWTSEWAVREARDDRVVLTLDHHGDARWPFAFAAEQVVDLTPDTLTVTLSAQNREAFDAPLACGHHPYFPAAGARLRFAAERRWPPDARMLPRDPVEIADREVDFAVAERTLDCAFSGWDGIARIVWSERMLQIESDVDHAVVYTPAGAPHFCIEPVAHLPNALSVRVAPGESHRATMRLIAQAASFGA